MGNQSVQQMLQDHAEDLGAGMTDSALHFEHEHDANWTRRKNFAPPKKVPTDPRTTSRPGAEWPYGPVTKAKSVEHDLATYVRWVQEVEHAYGSSNEVVLQRLRRLYYSSYGGALGDKFDAVIGDQPDAGGPPLDSRSISIEALDGLYETGTVRTPDGDSIDVSHILAILDLKTAGKSIRAVGASELRDVDWAGVLTWTGDLAWLFIQWVIRRHELDAAAGAAPATDAGPADVAGGIDRTIVIETARASSARRIVVSARDMALLDELAKIKSSKDDLLGDIDGTVIAARSLRGPTPNLVMPVSKILEQYYAYYGTGASTPTATKQQRFQNFVRYASPAIPHVTNSGGTAIVTPDAESAIHDAIRTTALLFLSRMSLDSSDPEATLTKYDRILREVARRFTRFLATGLATGDAAWP